MKRYFYQNDSVGFTKWCKNVPRIRYIIKRYRDSLSVSEKQRLKDEYEEALISHEQYVRLIKALTKEEQDYFNKYILPNKVPSYENYSKEISNHIFLIWRTLLFTTPREVEKLERVKLGIFLKEKRSQCSYSQEDICAFIGINIVSLRLIENGKMDIKAIHLYSMFWLYGVDDLFSI